MEIQDGKIQSKTGKAWGPSSEQGPDPGLVRAWLPGLPWLPEPRPRAPAQRSAPTTQALPEMPRGKTASSPRTAEASRSSQQGPVSSASHAEEQKPLHRQGSVGPASGCHADLHVCVFPPQTAVTSSVGMAWARGLC